MTRTADDVLWQGVRAVIFDMDGVLIDSEPIWVQAECAVFADHGCALRPQDCAETTGWRIDQVVALRLPDLDPRTQGQVADEIVAQVAARVRREGVPLPGAVEAVRAAAAGGHAVGLASSSPMVLIDAVLARLGLADVFDEVCSAEDEPLGKPHPAVYLTAARRLGVEPRACLVVEDSLTGLIAAKAAQMRCVVVPPANLRAEPRLALADTMVFTLTDLRVRPCG